MTFDTFVMPLWSSLTGSNFARCMAGGARDTFTPTWPTQNNPGCFLDALGAPRGSDAVSDEKDCNFCVSLFDKF